MQVYSEMAANEMDKWRTDTTDYQTRVANDAALPTPASEESGDSSDDEDIPVKTALTAVAKAQPAVESSSDSDESEAPPPPPVVRRSAVGPADSPGLGVQVEEAQVLPAGARLGARGQEGEEEQEVQGVMATRRSIHVVRDVLGRSRSGSIDTLSVLT